MNSFEEALKKKMITFNQVISKKISLLISKSKSYEDRLKELNDHGILDKLFPIGFIHMTFENVNPPLNDEYGVKWELLPEGYTLMTAHDKNTGARSGRQRLDDGGTDGHILTIDEMPRHSHTYVKVRAQTTYDYRHKQRTFQTTRIVDDGGKTSDTGGSQAHNHKLNVFTQKLMVWRRIS